MKERDLIDSQFSMAGEASGNLQSWWKGKQSCPSSHGAKKCPVKVGNAPYKTIRSHENLLTIMRTAWRGEGYTPMIQVSAPGPSHDIWELWEL